MPDAAYDASRAEFRLLFPDDPYNDVVGHLLPGAKVQHKIPMLSLDKCTTAAGFSAWFPGGCELLAQYKVDGMACKALYSGRGEYLSAATRGDGKLGEDITEHVRALFPPHITPPSAGRAFEIRGELYIPTAIFADKYSSEYANARNLVAGICSAYVDHRVGDIRFFAYGLLDAETGDSYFSWAFEDMDFLINATLDTDYIGTCSAPAEYESMLANLPDVPFEADGVVFTVMDNRVKKAMGLTAHHPRGAIAWKFPVAGDTTTILDVYWQVGRSGVLTPVASVAPVKLSGATVRRGTLHNVDRFLQMAPCKGDTVTMTRRGGVIPHIESIKHNGDGHAFPLPLHCPQCGHTLSNMRCVGDSCHTRAQRGLLHFASAIGLDGWGEALIETLADAGMLATPADFWRVEQYRDEMEKMPGLGKKSVEKLLAQIPTALPLVKLVEALGVPGLGPVAAFNICQKFSLEDLRHITYEQLLKVPRVGPGLADDIVEVLVPALRDWDIPVLDAPLTAPSGPLNDQVIVFTGEMQCMKRVPAQKRVVDLGGEAGDTVTRKTTVLVVADAEAAASNKRKRADELAAKGQNIKVLTEEEFLSSFPCFLKGAT